MNSWKYHHESSIYTIISQIAVYNIDTKVRRELLICTHSESLTCTNIWHSSLFIFNLYEVSICINIKLWLHQHKFLTVPVDKFDHTTMNSWLYQRESLTFIIFFQCAAYILHAIVSHKYLFFNLDWLLHHWQIILYLQSTSTISTLIINLWTSASTNFTNIGRETSIFINFSFIPHWMTILALQKIKILFLIQYKYCGEGIPWRDQC